MPYSAILRDLIMALNWYLAPQVIDAKTDLLTVLSADDFRTLVADGISRMAVFHGMTLDPDVAVKLRRVDKIAFELWRSHEPCEGEDQERRRQEEEEIRGELEAEPSADVPIETETVGRRGGVGGSGGAGGSGDIAIGDVRAGGDVHIESAVVYRVWYATNRKRGLEGFTGERDSKVHVGTCSVHVPKSHEIGSVGSSWWRRAWTGVDDRLQLTGIEELAPTDFWATVSGRLSILTLDEREAVIFVHGYNVSFDSAAIRAAQLGTDLAVRGGMAFFSWPSKGSVEGYPADEASIEASESAITQFLVDFAENSGASKLHIIAHSMGNRGVLRAINRIAASATERTGRPFDQIILAAPDVDADVFRDLCSAYSRVSRRTTLYVSSKDWAVEAARWLHGFPRAGLLPPIVVVPGIDTINVTHADLTLLGHGYVAEARLVLIDMHALLRFGASPKDRPGLQLQTSDDGQTYWLIGR